MFKSSFNRKLFGIAGAFLMIFNSFAWGPWDKGRALRKKWFPTANVATSPYKDPLLPFIHQEAYVSNSQFFELLENLSPEQRKNLWKALNATKNDPEGSVSAELLSKDLLWKSSSWTTYPFKKEVNYHETVKWVAKKLDVHKAECEAATTFQLERRIMEKVFAQLWDKMSQEQKLKILKESGLSPNDAAAYCSLSAAALLTTMGVTAAAMGFAFYIVVAKTVVVAAAAIFGFSAATTITAVAVLCGPIGWGIAALSAVTGALLLGGPNISKTAAFIIALHSMKANAMAKSKIDISQYILK